MPNAPAPQSFGSSLTDLQPSTAELAQLPAAAGVSTGARQPSTAPLFSASDNLAKVALAGLSLGSNQCAAGPLDHPSSTGSDTSFHHVDLLQQQQQCPHQPQPIPQLQHDPSLFQQQQQQPLSPLAMGHDPRLFALSTLSSPPHSSSMQFQQQQYRHQQLQQQASLSFSQRQAQAQAHPSTLQHPASHTDHDGPASPTSWSLSAAAGIAPSNNTPKVQSAAASLPGIAIDTPPNELMTALAPAQHHQQPLQHMHLQSPSTDFLSQAQQRAFPSQQQQHDHQRVDSGLVSPTFQQYQRPFAPVAPHSAGALSLAASPSLCTIGNLPNVAPAPMSLYSIQASASLSPISPALAPFPATSSSTAASLNQAMTSHILPEFLASSSASFAVAAAAASGSSGMTTSARASANVSGHDSDSASCNGEGAGENTPQHRTYHIFSRGSYDLMVWAILHGKGPDHRSISRACGDLPMTSKRWNRLQGNLRVIRISPPGAADGLVHGMVLHPRDDPTLPWAQAQSLSPDADMVEFRLVWRTCTRNLPIAPKEHWDAIFRSVHVRIGPDGRQFHMRLAECIRTITTNYQTRRSRCGITTDHIRQMFTQCECQTSRTGRPRGGRNAKSNPPGPSASSGGGGNGTPESNASTGAGSNLGSTFGGEFASGPSSVTDSASASGTSQQHVVNGMLDSTAYSGSPTSRVSHLSLSPSAGCSSGPPSSASVYTIPPGRHDATAMDVCHQPGSQLHSIPPTAKVFEGMAMLSPATSSREVPTLEQQGNLGTLTPGTGALVASWAVYGSGLPPAPVAMP